MDERPRGRPPPDVLGELVRATGAEYAALLHTSGDVIALAGRAPASPGMLVDMAEFALCTWRRFVFDEPVTTVTIRSASRVAQVARVGRDRLILTAGPAYTAVDGWLEGAVRALSG